MTPPNDAPMPDVIPDEIYIEFGNKDKDARVWVNCPDGLFPKYTRTPRTAAAKAEAQTMTQAPDTQDKRADYARIDRLIDMHIGKEDIHELDRGNLQYFAQKVYEEFFALEAQPKKLIESHAIPDAVGREVKNNLEAIATDAIMGPENAHSDISKIATDTLALLEPFGAKDE